VTDTPPVLPGDHRKQQLAEHAPDYVLKARLLGAGDDAIIDAITQAISASPSLKPG
jgi:hypothetical protein